MEDSTLDKRKERDNEADSETSDPSIIENPNKRPRVEDSPKENSPSPATPQKSPIMEKSSLADAFEAETPDPSLNSDKTENNNGEEKTENNNGEEKFEETENSNGEEKNENNNGEKTEETENNNGEEKTENNNGDASMTGSPSTDDNAATSTPVISKSDVPSPLTTQELEQKSGDSGNRDNDRDNGSTKSDTGIIQSEESKEKQQVKAMNSSSDAGSRSDGTGTSPKSDSKKSEVKASKSSSEAGSRSDGTCPRSDSKKSEVKATKSSSKARSRSDGTGTSSMSDSKKRKKSEVKATKSSSEARSRSDGTGTSPRSDSKKSQVKATKSSSEAGSRSDGTKTSPISDLKKSEVKAKATNCSSDAGSRSDGTGTSSMSDSKKKKSEMKARKSSSEVRSRSDGTKGTSLMSDSKKSPVTSTSNSKLKSSGKSGHQSMMTSSPDSNSEMGMPKYELEVIMIIRDPNSSEEILKETVINSDTKRMDAFLGQHNMKLLAPSRSRGLSWRVTPLGATIPRNSIFNIAADRSESPSPDELMKPPAAPVSKTKKRIDGPKMSSTKIDDSSKSSSGKSDRLKISPNPKSNREDNHSTGKSQATNPPKKVKTASKSKLTDVDEGIGVAPSSSVSPRKAALLPKARKHEKAIKIKERSKSSLAASVASNDSERSSGKKPAKRPRVGSANNFPIIKNQTPSGLSAVLSTPPPARSVARIEGTQAKPMSKFEQDMNTEPVVESELEKSDTLWSSILPQELVFARWRDKNYYSGMVKSKGLNDAWIIDFDDGMEDVASESHIIPVRILGVGVSGVYTVDDRYDPKQAVIIGQKFQTDEDVGGTAVKYAIKCDNDTEPIWCSRRQLVIKESDAKKLKSQDASMAAGKAAKISMDNIISEPRRRTRVGTSEGPPNKRKRVVRGALDEESSADDKLLESSTPKARGTPKGGKKTPATEPKKKRKRSSSTSTSTPQTKDASTSSPAKKSPPKEPIISTPKSAAMEPGKKRTKKTLFQGLQFFLTASGGGDPGISGKKLKGQKISGQPATPPIPYDKDEYRELIESCGGEILDTVGNEEKPNVFLISYCYARTVKYMYCLAAGIPCVSHCWIKQCLDNHEIVEWSTFTLPAGWSLEHQDLIQHHVNKPLKGCKVFVASESDQLYNYWKPVLTAAEAVLLKPSRTKGTLIPTGTEVVVADHSDNTPDILEEAANLNVPVVKPEWLVQTIITGEKAHQYEHGKYKIVLNEAEESEDFLGESSVDAGANDQVNDVMAHMQSPD